MAAATTLLSPRTARWRFVGMVAIAAVLAGLAPGASAVGAGDPPMDTAPPLDVEPADDPFYSAPAGVDLAALRPGDILRVRPLAVTAGRLPVPVEGWQLLVRSTDSNGDPVPVVASIMLPVAPYLAGEHRPLLSYQVAIDALGDQCQPSYTLRDGTEAELLAMAPALASGWAVVTTDFEGPNHAYGAGPMAGHGVLDGIRAALAFGPAGLDADASPVGLIGYSGGGQATTWAAELHGTYAPELGIVGIAGGGVPVDLNQVARHLDGALEAGIAIAAGAGIDREFPAMDLAGLLNARGREVIDEVADQCIEDFAAGYPGVRLADLSDLDDPLSEPRIVEALAANSLAKVPPVAPFYLWHSIADQLIPIAGADTLANFYCQRGNAPFFYDRNAAGEHITFAIAGAPAAFAFLADRFAGLPAPDNCDAVPALTGTASVMVPDRGSVLNAIASASVPDVETVPHAASTENAAEHPGRQYGTNPPPGANDWDCVPTGAHPRPVVLVHGLGAQARSNWSSISPQLANAGYCVFALDYGRRADAPPPFTEFGGIIPMEESANQLAQFVDAVLQATAAEQVDIVGHSEGSLMPNYYVKFLGGDRRVGRYIGLTPLWDGTALAGSDTLVELGRPSGFTTAVEGTILEPTCQSCPQFIRGSSFLRRMSEGPTGPRVPGVTYTMIMTSLDELVVPYTSGFMTGATNIIIQDQCTNDISEHAAVAVDPVVLQNILTALDPSNPTPIDCGAALTYLQ